MKFFKLVVCALFVAVNCGGLHAEERVLRVGHFPNLTHAAGLALHAKWRADQKAFEASLGENVRVEWYSYNAGPSAMEALLIDAIDLTYVGPNPALNAYTRSKGEDVRVIAGATFGGAALLIQAESQIKVAKDFAGKKIGTPQLGNTQDVAARAWLLDNGIHVTQTGGEAQVIPAENPDLLSLFSRRELDAVWTVEPWVTRLEKEAHAKVFLSEDNAVTTILVSSVKALKQKSDLVSAFLRMHRNTTELLGSAEKDSKALVAAELKAETSREVSADIIDGAWRRMRFSSRISKSDFQHFVTSAQRVGFLKEVSDISGMMHVLE